VICRLWHGWTQPADADAYESYLRDDLFARLREELAGRGYRGYHVLRRDLDVEVEFVTMVWFDSLDDVRAFAGDDHRTPVISGRAAELLSRHAPVADHFRVAAAEAAGF
jgi:heme-degrading monooxygenase HmoA